MSERQRFEAWYSRAHPHGKFHYSSVTNTYEADVQEAWQAWQAAKADVEPVLESAKAVVNTEDGYLEDLFDAVDDLTAKLEHYEGNHNDTN